MHGRAYGCQKASCTEMVACKRCAGKRAPQDARKSEPESTQKQAGVQTERDRAGLLVDGYFTSWAQPFTSAVVSAPEVLFCELFSACVGILTCKAPGETTLRANPQELMDGRRGNTGL